LKRLFLLRHAKASRDEPGIDDSDRVLAPRGREDAALMGRFLKDEVYLPDQILCSTSARTRETLALLQPQLGAHPAVQYLEALYLAEADEIIALVSDVRDSVGALMVIGHNPGMEDCARALVRPPEDRKLRKRYDSMSAKFPTGALAVIDFDIESWSGIGGWTGELELFMRPKDLREEA